MKNFIKAVGFILLVIVCVVGARALIKHGEEKADKEIYAEACELTGERGELVYQFKIDVPWQVWDEYVYELRTDENEYLIGAQRTETKVYNVTIIEDDTIIIK